MPQQPSKSAAAAPDPAPPPAPPVGQIVLYQEKMAIWPAIIQATHLRPANHDPKTGAITAPAYYVVDLWVFRSSHAMQFLGIPQGTEIGYWAPLGSIPEGPSESDAADAVKKAADEKIAAPPPGPVEPTGSASPKPGPTTPNTNPGASKSPNDAPGGNKSPTSV